MYRALGNFDEPMDPVHLTDPPKPINDALGWLLFCLAVGGFILAMLGLSYLVVWVADAH